MSEYINSSCPRVPLDYHPALVPLKKARNRSKYRSCQDPHESYAGGVAQRVRACGADATIPGSSLLGCRGSRICGNPGTSSMVSYVPICT